MPTDSSSPDDDERAPGPKPLSRRASRLFVIASILFVIAATAFSTYYLVSMTSQALDTPTEATDTTTVEDSSAVSPER